MSTRSFSISAALHVVLILALLWSGVLFLRAPSVPQGIEMQVIQAPKLAPAGPAPSRKSVLKRPPVQPPKPLTDQVVAGDKSSARAKAPDSSQGMTSDAAGARAGLPQATEEYLVSRMPELAADFRVPYPEEAKERGIQGSVVFDLLVDSEGKVRDAQLIQGPGAGLNEAASKAVFQLRFRPAVVNASDGEKPVAVKIRYAYRFVLEK